MRGVRWLVLARLGLSCGAAVGCNDADMLAHPAVSGVAGSQTLDAAMLSCDYAAQLARHALPAGLANVFVNCEWPLQGNDGRDDLSWLVGEMGADDSSASAARCSADPYFWWQEPRPPLLPRKFVYCSRACSAVKSWVTCKLRDDSCNASNEQDAAVTDDDAGPFRCGP
jgi:hypothetical protein